MKPSFANSVRNQVTSTHVKPMVRYNEEPIGGGPVHLRDALFI